MNTLMSDIMNSARGKGGHQVTPLDLRWNNFTRHTCDRFIVQEDMRSEPEVECSTGDEMDYQIPGMTSPSQQSSDDFCDTSSYDQGEATINKPLSFSIASILGGNCSGNKRESDVPAHVSSPFSDGYLQYYSYINNWQSESKSTYFTSDINQVRGVTMLTTKTVYWCHVCNHLIEDLRSAEKHQYVHRIESSKCSLKRSMLGSHGYVTPHELMDSERIKCGLCCKVVSTCFFSKHQRLHDGHFCSVCDQEFSTNSRLTDHMNVHSGRTPFECKICDRKFAKRSSLTQHLRYHRDNKSFMCRFCYKCFNSKYACAVHERLHTGENPFKCKYPGCKRAYPQKIQLKLHINSHHR